jgi:hypothetical protein
MTTAVDRVTSLVALTLSAAAAALPACGGPAVRHFPLRDPVVIDGDTRPVSVRCHEVENDDKKETVCTPDVYESGFAWDAADNSVFRPLSKLFQVDPARRAPNVNSLDEVPDSAWFTNRIGVREVPLEELGRGACTPEAMLDGEHAAPQSWLVDRGKTDGSSPGFRVKVPGKGKYMLKSDGSPTTEKPSAASVIGAAVYHAVGFNTSCEQLVYVAPSALKLAPGLTVTDNTGITRPFDRAALDKLIASSVHRGALVRFQGSAWLPGRLLGPFRYEETRADDPNDVFPHEERRELRGGRLLAAWIQHIDAREQNTMDSWIAVDSKHPESSPGYVRHYYLDTSDSFGTEWAWDVVSRALSHSYLLDYQYISEDFLTFGIIQRPWDRARKTPGQEVFAYYSNMDFDPETWVNEYPNPAFSRMTESDGAWMARILARFTPAHVKKLAEMGQFAEPGRTAYLADLLEARLRIILMRYLQRLSPVANVHLEGSTLCATDVARAREVFPAESFRYEGELRVEGRAPAPLAVAASEAGRVCVGLPPVEAVGARREKPGYVIVRIANGASKGPLDAHLYAIAGGGYRLVGLERPEE